MLRLVFITVFFLMTACQEPSSNDEKIQVSTTAELSTVLQPYVAVSHSEILLTNITIISGDGKAVNPDQWLSISGGKIKATGRMSELSLNGDTLVLDLTGHTVLPGLIGMHNHLHMPGNPLLEFSAPRLYLAGGVTTIAPAGSADPMGEAALASRINAGEEPGPTIILSAPYITGVGGNPPMDKPQNRNEAEQFVELWAARGAKWFKLYRHTDPDIAAVVIEAAHKKGLRVTGHLCSITYAEAARMGIDSLEHGISAAADFVLNRQSGECAANRASLAMVGLESAAIGELITTLIENEVTLTSTLAILETAFAHRPQGDARTLAALSPSRVEAYEARQIRLAENQATSVSTPELWDFFTGFERKFAAAGGRLVAGPDTGRHVIPGFGDQRNFELLAESGFSIPEVVRIMTFNGAETLGIADQVGRIEPGLNADLLVVKGDLVADPTSIRNVRYVFKRGLGFDPAPLLKDVQGIVGDR